MEDAPKQASFEIGIGTVFQGLCAFPNNQLIGHDANKIDHIAIPGFMMLTFDRDNGNDPPLMAHYRYSFHMSFLC